MWLLTDFGFFSVVEKPGDGRDGALTVRARAREDLEALRARYLPELGEIQEGGASDYEYRARVAREPLALAVAQIVRGIDYANFKSTVGARQGHERAAVYGRVWGVLRGVK